MDTQPRVDGVEITPLASLRRYVRPRSVRERCELCDAGLGDEHLHLVELSSRRLLCACDACAILFSNQVGTKYRRVPRRVRLLGDFQLTDEMWEALQLPINLAFFLKSSTAQRVVVFYPSPAGATESLVTLDAWESLTESNPALAQLEPDVEALLVNRMGSAREHYLVGIDECYKLVGAIRAHWRGLSGGKAAWDEMDRFFEEMKRRSAPATPRRSDQGATHA